MKTKDAIAEFETAHALAAALGITPSAVSQWGDEVPQLRAYQIRELLEQRQSNAGLEKQAA